jgi:hypothetical protein
VSHAFDLQSGFTLPFASFTMWSRRLRLTAAFLMANQMNVDYHYGIAVHVMIC